MVTKLMVGLAILVHLVLPSNGHLCQSFGGYGVLLNRLHMVSAGLGAPQAQSQILNPGNLQMTILFCTFDSKLQLS